MSNYYVVHLKLIYFMSAITEQYFFKKTPKRSIDCIIQRGVSPGLNYELQLIIIMYQYWPIIPDRPN